MESVRPISGITHGDETRDGRASNVSKGHGEEGEDVLDNYNVQALYEIDESRRKIKEQIAKYEEEQRKKRAAEEKKNAKK